jgi:uncharacterized membrane protein YgdD (TMEM256/DUF423 family)
LDQATNMSANASARRNRVLAAIGALLAAGAVALAAYAAHGAEGLAQARLQTAAAFAFGHGLALAALAGHAERLLDRTALYLLLAGTVLFCGGVVAGTLFGTGSVVAPLGGGLLIAGWLLRAVGAVRG